MVFKKNTGTKWKWRPKRWWIGLIAFWLFSTTGARLFGIEPNSEDHARFILILTFLAAIFAAVTDRDYSIPKKILLVILVPIVYEIIYTLGVLMVGHQGLAAVVTSLLFVGFLMRRSKYFVERVSEAEIIDENNKENIDQPTTT